MPNVPTLIGNPDGSIRAVNLKRLNEMPYFLGSNRRTTQITGATLPAPDGLVTVAGQQSSPPTLMSISGEGPAQITQLSLERFPTAVPYVGNQIGTVLLQIQDGQTMRALMNGAAHVDTIFGNHDVAVTPNTRPYPLPEALYVDEQRAIVASWTNLHTAENNFRPSLECGRLLTRQVDSNLARVRARMDKKQYLSLPYWYVLDNGFTTLAALLGDTRQETITIGQDHHFEIFQLTAVSDGPFSINIVNLNTGESIIYAPLGTTANVSSGLSIGSAAFPFRFHEPIFCELHTKLLVTLVNRTAAANQIYLSLGGRVLADRMWR